MHHPFIVLGTLFCLLTLSLNATAQETFSPDQELIPTTNAMDGFGSAVAQDRDLMAVGIPYVPSINMMSSGGAIIYKKSNGNWVQEATVILPGSEIDTMNCGTSIAVHNGSKNGALDVAIIGCPGFDMSKGAAYVLMNTNQGWRITERLNPPSNITSEGFGDYVAIAGNNAIVGSQEILLDYTLQIPGAGIKQSGSSTVLYSKSNAFITNFSAKGPWVSATILDDQGLKIYAFRYAPAGGTRWKQGSFTLVNSFEAFSSITPKGPDGASIAVVEMTNSTPRLKILDVNKDVRMTETASGSIRDHGLPSFINPFVVANLPDLVVVQTNTEDTQGNPDSQHINVYQVQSNAVMEVADYVPDGGVEFLPGMTLSPEQLFVGRLKGFVGAVMTKSTTSLTTTTDEERIIITITSPTITAGSTYTSNIARPTNFEGTCQTNKGNPCDDLTLSTDPNGPVSVNKKGNGGDFEIEFNNDLKPNQPVAFTLKGMAPNAQDVTFSFIVVYDPEAPMVKAPQIDAPSDKKAFDIENVQGIVLNFTLDDNVPSQLELLYRAIDSDDWDSIATVTDATSNYTWSIGKTWKQGSYELIATTQGQETRRFFSIYDSPTIHVDGFEYTEDPKPTVGLTFTLDGKSGTEDGNVVIKLNGQTLKNLTANDAGEWSTDITVNQTGDIELEIEVTTAEGLLVEYEDDLTLSVINDIPDCTATNCANPPIDNAPEKLETGLCTSTHMPHAPTSGLGMVLLILGWLGWRRRTNSH